MQLIVISSPLPVPSEGSIINRLFELGLDCFHLRKPDMNQNELTNFWYAIEPAFRSKVAWHQQHNIATELGANRLHFPENQRRYTAEQTLLELKHQGNILSTSTHKPDDLQNVTAFEYAFLGPVFNSISKPGYTGTITEDFCLPKQKHTTKMIALGGIASDKILQIRKMNFDGVAVLGTIWNKQSAADPQHAIDSFLTIQKTIQNTTL